MARPPPHLPSRSSVRGYIERLGPYQSLLLLAIPASLVEPLKLIAVAVAGTTLLAGSRVVGAVIDSAHADD